jgi:hypothetical protein
MEGRVRLQIANRPCGLRFVTAKQVSAHVLKQKLQIGFSLAPLRPF